ncbi:hypothetical protein [Actinomadura sp. 3N508]|uniref:hypothetical protein n=1 Tax=Actinomadura sp. 3N508 TaxID=3375153 RepID=UPI0037B29032
MKTSFKSIARIAVPVAVTATALTLSGGAVAQASPAAQAAPGAPALADDPIPTFDFTDCPALPAGSAPRSSLCFNAVVTSGQMVLGKFTQNLTKPIRMTFATAYNPDTRVHTPVFGRMRSDKMLVMPGIFGDPILTAVYARPEYAGGFDIKNFQVKLNLKVRLTNPFLGGTCLIGDDRDPIRLDLITGTTSPPPPNTPITGKPPVIIGTDGTTVTRSLGHVDNSFSVPGARGCALDIGLVNQIVNAQAGVPSAAGRNTMIFNEYVGYRTYATLPA